MPTFIHHVIINFLVRILQQIERLFMILLADFDAVE
jgi:hypothetical protein